MYINQQSNMNKNIDNVKDYIEASQEELLFIRHNMPRGMVAMICHRTGASRSRILYQIMQMPENQDIDIIQATREIFKAVTGFEYSSNT